MRVFLMAWVLMTGCVAGGAQPRRWPEHRKQGDARLAQLEQQQRDLEAKVDALTKQLAATQAQLAAATQPPAESSR
jgi:outer membrane murein-binding lipoprotein Lpp